MPTMFLRSLVLSASLLAPLLLPGVGHAQEAAQPYEGITEYALPTQDSAPGGIVETRAQLAADSEDSAPVDFIDSSAAVFGDRGPLGPIVSEYVQRQTLPDS